MRVVHMEAGQRSVSSSVWRPALDTPEDVPRRGTGQVSTVLAPCAPSHLTSHVPLPNPLWVIQPMKRRQRMSGSEEGGEGLAAGATAGFPLALALALGAAVVPARRPGALPLSARWRPPVVPVPGVAALPLPGPRVPPAPALTPSTQ